MGKTYKARANSSVSDAQAKVFARFIDAEFHDERITPEEVVSRAKDPDCPIHEFFEWDNRKAAHKYRLCQARNYLNCVVVEERGSEIRAFHHVTIQGGHYVPLEKARNTPEIWEQIVSKALQEAENWARRYEQYKQLAPIRDAIRAVVNKVHERNHEKQERSVG